MSKKSHNNNYNKYNNQNNILKIENSIDNEAKLILDKISQQSLIENENNNFDDLIKLFNANQLKKTMQRILKSNQLLDKITEQTLTRFINNPDEYTNQDLLNYMKVLQDLINNSQKTLSSQQEQINKPFIQINQQNINNVNTEISKESQEKILNVVNQFMNLLNNENNANIIEGEVQNITEGDENNE